MWNKTKSNWPLVIIIIVIGIVTLSKMLEAFKPSSNPVSVTNQKDSSWVAPSLYTDEELQGEERKLVIYGEDLIANTAAYFGPHGTVAAISNGMNCQNCHLNAGRKNWGNNYSAVYSTYPKFRERSGAVESIYKRVSDCFERSLNGKAPDSNSREYQAIEAYIRWVGKDIKKGVKPAGSGIKKLPFPDRAADPEKGRIVYNSQCQSCHGPNGQGQLKADSSGYEYPPLWGVHSYNSGAGLYRLSSFAGYVYCNMPFKVASPDKPVLDNLQAWDVAAFVNSQPRPAKDLSGDWPDISKKPFDHPFGPYADDFTEIQHKYGPFQPIQARKEELTKKK